MSTSERADVPVDPDVDPDVPARGRSRAADAAVLAVVAVGGILGAEARYGLERWWPTPDGGWPAATATINLSGSFLLGALMVLMTELTSPHRLLRPFLGVGVLGGFTTFSTAMVEVRELMDAGRPELALAYLVGSAVAALLAGALGSIAVRAAGERWRRLRREARRR